MPGSRGGWKLVKLSYSLSPGDNRPRVGGCCRQPAMGNGRCRMHGGLSTGPRTAEGLARARRARWKHGFDSAETRALRREAAQTARNLAALVRLARAELRRRRGLVARRTRPQRPSSGAGGSSSLGMGSIARIPFRPPEVAPPLDEPGDAFLAWHGVDRTNSPSHLASSGAPAPSLPSPAPKRGGGPAPDLIRGGSCDAPQERRRTRRGHGAGVRNLSRRETESCFRDVSRLAWGRSHGFAIFRRTGFFRWTRCRKPKPLQQRVRFTPSCVVAGGTDR